MLPGILGIHCTGKLVAAGVEHNAVPSDGCANVDRFCASRGIVVAVKFAVSKTAAMAGSGSGDQSHGSIMEGDEKAILASSKGIGKGIGRIQ